MRGVGWGGKQGAPARPSPAQLFPVPPPETGQLREGAQGGGVWLQQEQGQSHCAGLGSCPHRLLQVPKPFHATKEGEAWPLAIQPPGERANVGRQREARPA